MEYHLSEDSLQRGTFPWERSAGEPVDGYSVHLSYLDSCKYSNNFLDHRISNLSKSLMHCSVSVKNGIEPEWIGFLYALVAKSDIDPSLQFSYSEFFFELGKKAYFSPFFKIAECFLHFTNTLRLNDLVASEHTHHVCRKLTEFYLSRLVETSQFVFHLKFIQSNLKYSEWCYKYKSCLPDVNPWFSIAEEYPILIRWLANIDKNCRLAVAELFNRFSKDKEEILSKFDIPPTAKISDLKMGLSDPHRKGKSVTIFFFDDGSRLVYKPKSLDIDNALLDLFTTNLTNVGIAPIKILAKQDYGWAEYIDYSPTLSVSSSKAKAIGQASALFWLLNSTDLHSENVFANDTGVFALDLETLLLAPAKKNDLYSDDLWRNHSIYTTMLFDFSFGEKRKQNISGFDPSDNLTTIAPKIHFSIVDDGIAVEQIKPADGVPAYGTNKGKQFNNINHILDGFDTLLNGANLDKIRKFVCDLHCDTVMRIVFRDTYFYDRILDKMRQPRFLRDGALLYLDLFKLHLGLANASAHDEKLHLLVEDEITQLLEGDIPYFSNKVGNCDLNISSGKIANFFLVPGSEHSLKKLQNFEKSDINEQKALIQVALGCYQPQPRRSLSHNSKIVLRPFLDLAHNIIDSAFCPRNSLSRWISMFGDISGRESRIFIGDKGYFSGSLGILLGLQAAEIVLSSQGKKDKTITKFIDNQSIFYDQFLQRMADNKTSGKMLLGFSGLGGEILAHSILLTLNSMRWSFLSSYIEKSLTGIEEEILSDKWLDVIGGSAGLLLGCQHLLTAGHQHNFSNIIRVIQSACATHLISQAQVHDGGLAWVVPNEKLPLVGYAHGCAGIIAALSSISKNNVDINLQNSIDTTLECATHFLDYSLDAYGEWPDQRGGERKPLNRSWCNGIPGVLRGLMSVNALWTESIRGETSSLFDKTMNLVGSSDVYRVCCGEMGNVDFLLDYARLLESSEEKHLISKIYPVAEQILLSLLNDKSTFEPERAFQGLFHGQSGMLYTAARFFIPELPSLTGHRFSALKMQLSICKSNTD